jgi:putative endonuclease
MAWVYIMAQRRFGPIYVGATTNLLQRVWQHKNDVLPGFVRDHQCHLLVWFEEQQNMYWALQRERNIKHWVRQWKNELIEAGNPEWDDLYLGIAQG